MFSFSPLLLLRHVASAYCQPVIKFPFSACRNLIIGGLALLCVWHSVVAEESENRESQIATAYLYHFTKFTEWPTVLSVFHYCVYDDANFTDLLRTTYKGKNIGEAAIEVKNINSQTKLEDCQLIYFPNNSPADFLRKVSEHAILSVGIQKDFIENNGVIYLFVEDQKLRFYINNNVAINAGLKISSQLLKLSKEP